MSYAAIKKWTPWHKFYAKNKEFLTRKNGEMDDYRRRGGGVKQVSWFDTRRDWVSAMVNLMLLCCTVNIRKKEMCLNQAYIHVHLLYRQHLPSLIYNMYPYVSLKSNSDLLYLSCCSGLKLYLIKMNNFMHALKNYIGNIWNVEFKKYRLSDTCSSHCYFT